MTHALLDADATQPTLSNVVECVTRWEEIERLSAAARVHISTCMCALGTSSPQEVIVGRGIQLLDALTVTGDRGLQLAVCTVLESALDIPKRAGVDVRAALNGSAKDDSGLPTLAGMLFKLCNAAESEVRSRANALLKHLQQEALADAARMGPYIPTARAAPVVQAAQEGDHLGVSQNVLDAGQPGSRDAPAGGEKRWQPDALLQQVHMLLAAYLARQSPNRLASRC